MSLGHRTLYGKKILYAPSALLRCLASYLQPFRHRDISISNLMITPHREVGHRGMLIDMDYAKHMDDNKTIYDDERSGTKIFMGIGAYSSSFITR